MIPLACLAIFSGFSLNLLFSFALGASSIAGDDLSSGETRKELPLFQFAVFFFSVLFLWIIFAHLLPANWRGFVQYFLCFPVSALACMVLEYLGERLSPRIYSGLFPRRNAPYSGIKKVYPAFTAYDGLVPVSLLLTLALAGSFAGALILALFFVIGNLAAMLILNEIRRRSTLEMVPRFLRGSPLILISMGLLSLISAAAAGISLKILEVF